MKKKNADDGIYFFFIIFQMIFVGIMETPSNFPYKTLKMFNYFLYELNVIARFFHDSQSSKISA